MYHQHQCHMGRRTHLQTRALSPKGGFHWTITMTSIIHHEAKPSAAYHQNGKEDLLENEGTISKGNCALPGDVCNGSHQHMVLHKPQPLPSLEVSALPATSGAASQRESSWTTSSPCNIRSSKPLWVIMSHHDKHESSRSTGSPCNIRSNKSPRVTMGHCKSPWHMVSQHEVPVSPAKLGAARHHESALVTMTNHELSWSSTSLWCHDESDAWHDTSDRVTMTLGWYTCSEHEHSCPAHQQTM